MGRKKCCDFGQAPPATKGDGSSASLMIRDWSPEALRNPGACSRQNMIEGDIAYEHHTAKRIDPRQRVDQRSKRATEAVCLSGHRHALTPSPNLKPAPPGGDRELR